MHLAHDLGGDDENAGPDHRPDDERGRIESGDGSNELDALWLDRGNGGRSHQANLVANPEGRYLPAVFPPSPPEEIPCVSCREKRSSSPSSSKSPTETKKLSCICANCSRRRRTAARPTSKRSSGSSTKPIR